MKKQKVIKIFLSAIVAFILSLAGSISLVETKAESVADLHVLWIQDYQNNGETATFAIKTTASNTQVREKFQSKSFEYITINGYTLTEILSADKTACVQLDGVFLRVTISAGGYKYCLSECDKDRIIIEKGFSFISGEVAPYDFTYTWDNIFEKYMVIPDASLLDTTQCNTALLRDIVFDSTNERQLFIHFAYPISMDYMSCIQYDPEGMSKQFRSIGWSDPNDLYISQLSLFGIRESMLNNILVDGKSLNEWMAEDGPYVADPENLVKIAVHGTGRDRGRYLTVEFGYASSCLLSNNESHTLTLKKGLVFPSLYCLVEDVTMTYNPETDIWGTKSVDEEFESLPIQQQEKGCSGTIADVSALLMAVAMGIVGIRLIKRKEEKCNED